MGPGRASRASNLPRSSACEQRTSDCGRTTRYFSGLGFFSRGSSTPRQPLICAFIDEMRAEGYAIESILRVLSEQCPQVSARTYRSWKNAGRRRCPHRHKRPGGGQDPQFRLSHEPCHRAGPDEARGSIQAVEVGRAAPPPRRSRGHLPRSGGQGDADPRPVGHPAGELGSHHDPWSGWEACRRPGES